MNSLLVEYKGNRYWFLGQSFDMSGAFAPLSHCDEEGNPTHMYGELSFAHWVPSQGLMQYGHKIGDREDITIVDADR